jgi:thiol:disulfide interchange protein DsbA
MSRLFWITALLLTLAACGKEEPVAPPADESVVTDGPAAIEEPTADEAVEATDEVLEVVEESAAEPAPEEETIVLAQADAPVAPAEWKYREGRHYVRLVPTQPTLGGPDKIEVAEFFYYLCPHCDTVEPIIKRWAENKPANARFVQIPAMWNNILVRHAQMYYTHEVLARNGVLADGPGFHATVFREIHDRNNRLATEGAIQAMFERFGVSAEEFNRAWKSFEVAQKMRVAQDLARRYSVSSTPTFVVNGKYRTGASEAGGYPQLLELIDELVLRESLR